MLTKPPSSVVTVEDRARDSENRKFPTGVSEAQGYVAVLPRTRHSTDMAGVPRASILSQGSQKVSVILILKQMWVSYKAQYKRFV